MIKEKVTIQEIEDFDDRYSEEKFDRNVKLKEMECYLLGAAHVWCRDRKGEDFGARDLFGGNNFFGEGTPLYELYKFYLGEKGDNATAQTEAANAVGILLKKVLYDDRKREYSTKKVQETRNGKLMDIRKYCWTGVECRN